MPFNVNAAREYARPLVVKFSTGDEVHLKYRPMAYNGEDSAAYSTLIRDGKVQEATYEWIARVVAEWDVEMDKKVVPLKVADLKKVPYVVLDVIQAAIFEDGRVNPLREPAFSAGSIPEGEKAA